MLHRDGFAPSVSVSQISLKKLFSALLCISCNRRKTRLTFKTRSAIDRPLIEETRSQCRVLTPLIVIVGTKESLAANSFVFSPYATNRSSDRELLTHSSIFSRVCSFNPTFLAHWKIVSYFCLEEKIPCKGFALIPSRTFNFYILSLLLFRRSSKIRRIFRRTV